MSFDIAAHNALQRGENPDRALIVTFEYESEPNGDGTFRNVEMINIWIDKDNTVRRRVTAEDRERFRDRYEAFKRGEEVPADGTPINLCTFATPADVATCKAERILTLEQLAETPDERLQRSRNLINFKYKVQDWLKARSNTSHVAELREQIERLKAQIDALKEKNAALAVGAKPRFTLKALKGCGMDALREYCEANGVTASNSKDGTIERLVGAGAVADDDST